MSSARISLRSWLDGEKSLSSRISSSLRGLYLYGRDSVTIALRLLLGILSSASGVEDSFLCRFASSSDKAEPGSRESLRDDEGSMMLLRSTCSLIVIEATQFRRLWWTYDNQEQSMFGI